jgi:hypothetical protein
VPLERLSSGRSKLCSGYSSVELAAIVDFRERVAAAGDDAAGEVRSS